jgi:hypothetical protein
MSSSGISTVMSVFRHYRFFPAFFIRSAYAALARIEAALRIAAVQRGRLRAWFGEGVSSMAGIALLRGLPPREVPCPPACEVPPSTSIARLSLSRSDINRDRI